MSPRLRDGTPPPSGDCRRPRSGLAGDLPAEVTTGCGVRVPYAMTSPRPDRVTCLACREHARSEHLRLAEWVERLAGMPGAPVGPVQAAEAAARHRELAARFAGT